MAVNWLGRAVTKKLRAAQIAGVNQTMSACVVRAKRNHPWRNVTATLEGSIDIDVYARAEGRGVKGVWGSRDVRYALIQELGGTIRPRTAKRLLIRERGEVVASATEVTLPPRPYLRPAADAEYPALSKRIRRAYEGASR